MVQVLTDADWSSKNAATSTTIGATYATGLTFARLKAANLLALGHYKACHARQWYSREQVRRLAVRPQSPFHLLPGTTQDATVSASDCARLRASRVSLALRAHTGARVSVLGRVRTSAP